MAEICWLEFSWTLSKSCCTLQVIFKHQTNSAAQDHSLSLTLQPTRPLSLVSLSLPLSSNRSWSRVYRGGGEWWGRHLWPSAAFCGLYYPCVIVLRDVDNHNRRRAGKPQSRGRNQGQLMVGGGGKKWYVHCVYGWEGGIGGWEERAKLISNLLYKFWICCWFLVASICSLPLNRMRGRLGWDVSNNWNQQWSAPRDMAGFHRDKSCCSFCCRRRQIMYIRKVWSTM